MAVVDRSARARLQRRLEREILDFLQEETGYEASISGPFVRNGEHPADHYEQEFRYPDIPVGVKVTVVVYRGGY